MESTNILTLFEESKKTTRQIERVGVLTELMIAAMRENAQIIDFVLKFNASHKEITP